MGRRQQMICGQPMNSRDAEQNKMETMYYEAVYLNL